MDLLVEFGEVSPIDNVPITLKPGFDEGFRTGLPQSENVSRVIAEQEHIIPELGRDENPLQPYDDSLPVNFDWAFFFN
jgi:hypothetical protein